MLRRLRRPAAALSGLLLVSALAACGGGSDEADDPGSASSSADAGGSETGEEVEGVTFEGEVGEGLTVDFSAEVPQPAETTVTTVVEGDGEPVEEGDTVNTYLWLGNGTSQEQLFSDYDNGAPQALPYQPAQLDELFGSLLEDQTYGSRVVAVTTPEVVFGADPQGNQFEVQDSDSLVVVADLVDEQQASPEPSSDQPEDAEPDTQPSVVEEGGNPVGLDFEGIEEPELDQPVQRVVLEEGDGAPVTAQSEVTVNYLGSTYEADAPFDESYSRGEPLVSPLSGLIPGWTIGLTGVPVGSRVLLQIPPAYGYGAEGSGSGIPGNATLWFVIDIVSAQG